MTSNPDLQTVREIARQLLLNAANEFGSKEAGRNIGAAVHAEAGPGGLGMLDYTTWFQAVYEAMKAARFGVSWLDEQSDPEPDVCVCGDPNCMPYWRPVHEQMNAMRVHADKGAADFTGALLEEICELRTELEQVRAKLAHSESVVDAFHAEADRMSDRYDNLRDDYDRACAALDQERAQREDDQNANVRAVADAVSILEGMLNEGCDYCAADIGRVRGLLLDAFARPIEALDAREAVAGGVQPNGDPIWEEQ